jgi:hypothetical protein
MEAPKVKRVLKIKSVSLPPPTDPNIYWSPAVEAMELTRAWYAEQDAPVPAKDVEFCLAQIAAEKAQMEAEANAPPPQPSPEDELGPMPAYGTPEFWRWCMKRKAIRLAKEAAIIAAGGTVPEKKSKKPKAPKATAK